MSVEGKTRLQHLRFYFRCGLSLLLLSHHSRLKNDAYPVVHVLIAVSRPASNLELHLVILRSREDDSQVYLLP